MSQSQFASALSSFVVQLAALVGALLVIGGFGYRVAEPHARGWVSEIVSEVSASSTAQMEEIVSRLDALERVRRDSSRPVVSFPTHGHVISDTPIGGEGRVRIRFTKLRSCGLPLVSLLALSEETLFRFSEVSILDANGRGPAMPVDSSPQSISFSARVPDHSTIEPGIGRAWIAVQYPDCPSVPLARTPDIPFRILPSEESPQ